LFLNDFTYHRPATLEEACRLLERYKNCAPIAGGTDVLVEIKKGLRHNDEIISLKEIAELKLLNKDKNNLYIGAGVTHNEVKKSLIIKENFSALSEAASNIGTEQIRNTGTVGGNLCTGASCCDMAPVLIAYNADVEIASSTKRRVVSLKDFFIHHKETSLAKGEIMTKIIVPIPKSGQGVSFLKFGLREAASISVASVSVRISLDGDVCTDSCVVIGAVAPTPRISSKAIEVLNNKKITDLINNEEMLKSIGEASAKDSLPLDDLRGSAKFRKQLVNILTQRAVVTAAKRSLE
jgi:CO/xanthine dehydrogenase FAD-binding subunit